MAADFITFLRMQDGNKIHYYFKLVCINIYNYVYAAISICLVHLFQ